MALEKQDRKQMPLDISPPHLPALILLPVLMLILFSQSALSTSFDLLAASISVSLAGIRCGKKQRHH